MGAGGLGVGLGVGVPPSLHPVPLYGSVLRLTQPAAALHALRQKASFVIATLSQQQPAPVEWSQAGCHDEQVFPTTDASTPPEQHVVATSTPLGHWSAQSTNGSATAKTGKALRMLNHRRGRGAEMSCAAAAIERSHTRHRDIGRSA